MRGPPSLLGIGLRNGDTARAMAPASRLRALTLGEVADAAVDDGEEPRPKCPRAAPLDLAAFA